MKLIVLGAFGLMLPFLAFGQDAAIDDGCTQNGASACVDWDLRIVIAEGLGAPSSVATNPALKHASAIRAARLDAARNILEMIKGVNLSSNTTVRDAMVANDVIRTKISGFLHGLRPTGDPRYFSDGLVKVRMEARLDKTIPQELAYRDSLNQPFPAPAPLTPPVAVQPPVQTSSSAPTSAASAASVIATDRVYTGLVVDARNLGIQPAMSPKILDENGKEVYGSAYVDREFSIKHGMAGYLKELDKAKANDRVKSTPLVIKALKASGNNKTDLVVSNKDAEALRKIASTQSFLREARVVILL